MFEKKVWNDRQSEHPARRRLTPTENDNEYEVSRAEGLVMEEGDAFDATTMNDLENRVANAENHLQIICIRSVVQAVADAVLAVCKERKLTDAKLYTSHWA